MNDSHPFCSMSIGCPIPEIRLFQTLTIKLQGCRQRANVIQLAQYPINLLPFHFTSFRPTIPEIQLFQNFTLKHPRSRSWVKSKIKVTYHTKYPTNNVFPFISHQSDQPFRDMAKQCLTLKKILKIHIWNFKRKFAKLTVSNRTSPKSNQVVTMTRACFVGITGFFVVWILQQDILASCAWNANAIHINVYRNCPEGLEMVGTYRILIGLCPEIRVNKNP